MNKNCRIVLASGGSAMSKVVSAAVWISAFVILLGAEINAEMEHQTADTTLRSPKPRGARGARKADTVGAAQGG